VSGVIGELRHRLTLERLVQTTDGAGGFQESWDVEATVWARLRPLSGGEGVDAGRLAGRHGYEITIRYRPGVDLSMRFRMGARVFEIVSMKNLGERGRWLRALCEERDL
jgi:SPP1 family predicted phage head-tail adaptor